MKIVKSYVLDHLAHFPVRLDLLYSTPREVGKVFLVLEESVFSTRTWLRSRDQAEIAHEHDIIYPLISGYSLYKTDEKDTMRLSIGTIAT